MSPSKDNYLINNNKKKKGLIKMWEKFLEEVKATKTTNTYLAYLNSLSHFPSGSREEIINFIANKTIKDSTKKQHLTILLIALKWYGCTDKNLMRLAASFRPNEEEQPCPTTEEIEKIWRRIKTSRDKAMFALMAWNGLRVSEVAKLDVDDFNKGVLLLRNTKGKKDSLVPLVHDRVKTWLHSYLKKRKEIETDSNAMFLNNRKGRVTEVSIKKYIKNVCTSAGCPQYHCHSFRRFFANTLSRAGVPLQNLKECMRHRSVNTTMRYLNIGVDDIKKTLSDVYNKG